MLVNKEILLVLNVILNSQTTDNNNDRYMYMRDGDEVQRRPKMKENRTYTRSTEKQKHSYLLHYFLSVSWFRNSVWFSILSFFSRIVLFCFRFCPSYVCVCELISGTYRKFSFCVFMLDARKVFNNWCDQFSFFLCSHILSRKQKYGEKMGKRTLWHMRERTNKRNQNREIFCLYFFLLYIAQICFNSFSMLFSG